MSEEIDFDAIRVKSQAFQDAMIALSKSNDDSNLSECFQHIEETGYEFEQECKKQVKNAGKTVNDNCEHDSKHDERLQETRKLYMELVTTGFGEMIDKVRAKAGGLSEDVITAVLADSISSGVDLLTEEQILLMTHDDSVTSDSISPHMRRKAELGLV